MEKSHMSVVIVGSLSAKAPSWLNITMVTLVKGLLSVVNMRSFWDRELLPFLTPEKHCERSKCGKSFGQFFLFFFPIKLNVLLSLFLLFGFQNCSQPLMPYLTQWKGNRRKLEWKEATVLIVVKISYLYLTSATFTDTYDRVDTFQGGCSCLTKFRVLNLT